MSAEKESARVLRLVVEDGLTVDAAVEKVSTKSRRSPMAIKRSYFNFRQRQKAAGAPLAHGNAALDAETEMGLALAVQLLSDFDMPVRPSELLRMASESAGVTLSHSWPARFLERQKALVQPRTVKALTDGREETDALNAGARRWAERYLQHISGVNGSRISDRQVLNFDPTMFCMTPDSKRIVRIVSTYKTRANYKTMKRQPLCSVAPVINAAGRSLVIFINIGVHFPLMKSEKGEQAPKKKPRRAVADVKLYTPILHRRQRGEPPVYIIYSTKGYFNKHSFTACMRLVQAEFTMTESVSSQVVDEVDVVTANVKPSLSSVVLLDNSSVHIVPKLIIEMALKGMNLVFGQAHGTHIWQPLDAEPNAVIKNTFSKTEKNLSSAFALAHAGREDEFRAALIAAALDSVLGLDKKTILHGWINTHTLPSTFTVDDYVQHVQKSTGHMMQALGAAQDVRVSAATVSAAMKQAVSAHFTAAETTIMTATAGLKRVGGTVFKDQPIDARDYQRHLEAEQKRKEEAAALKEAEESARQERKRRRVEEKDAERVKKAAHVAANTCSTPECGAVRRGGTKWFICHCAEGRMVVCPRCAKDKSIRAAYHKHLSEVCKPPAPAPTAVKRKRSRPDDEPESSDSEAPMVELGTTRTRKPNKPAKFRS